MGKNTKTPIGVRFSKDELELLDEMAERHGGKTAALVAGLNALKQRNAITPEEAIAALAIEHGLDPPRKRKK